MSERTGSDSLWTVLAAVAQIFAALVGAAAVYFANQSLQETAAQGRRQADQSANVQTLTLFATFNSESMLQIRNSIDSEEWCARWHPDAHERTRPAALTREQLTWFVDFFDAVDACGDQGLCNPQLNQQLFKSYAATNYQPIAEAIIRGRQRGNEVFGQGMADLAGIEAAPEETARSYSTNTCNIDPGAL